MQTKSRVRSTLIFWPVTFQISGSEQESTVRANQFFFWPQETQAMYTMQRHARHTNLQAYYYYLRPPAREHQMKSAAMPQSFLRNHRNMWIASTRSTKIIWGIPQGKFYKINLNNELPELQRFHVSFVLFKKICVCCSLQLKLFPISTLHEALCHQQLQAIIPFCGLAMPERWVSKAKKQNHSWSTDDQVL